MITLAMNIRIAAPRAEVWRRLADPREVARWRPGAASVPRVRGPWPDRGAELEHRVWRRGLPLALRERVLEAQAPRRLRSAVRLGLYRFEATYLLRALPSPPGVPGATRMALRIVTEREAPLVGGVLDRFAMRRIAAELASSWTGALRAHCEERDAEDAAAGAVPLPAPDPERALQGGRGPG